LKRFGYLRNIKYLLFESNAKCSSNTCFFQACVFLNIAWFEFDHKT
jgi:hypothetical protein